MSPLCIGRLRTKLFEDQYTEAEEKVPLGHGDWQMTKTNLPDYIPGTVIGVYWALRTLAYAMSMAGNYTVDSKKFPGTKVLMMPFAMALDYADRAIRVVLACRIHPKEAMAWLIKRDQITRTAMAGLIRKHWPAGEALDQAIVDTQSDWTVISKTQVVGPHDSVALGSELADDPDDDEHIDSMVFGGRSGSGGGGGNGKDQRKGKGSGKDGARRKDWKSEDWKLCSSGP